MKITTEFEGLEQLQEKIVLIGGEKLLKEVNRKIITDGQERGARLAKPSLPKSRDHSESGPRRNGRRKTPPGHAADNIPIGPIETKQVYASGTIGWTPSNNDEHFYEKFPIYGTAKIEAQVGFEEVQNQVQSFIDRMGEEAYLKLLKEALE